MEHDFPKSQFARHYADLLGVIEGLPKHYHVAQGVHAYVLVSLWTLWKICIKFVVDIDIKI